MRSGRSERACPAVHGPRGGGRRKSRLSAEFLDGGRRHAVVRGRCLPYGEGITYWPVVEGSSSSPRTESSPSRRTLAALLGDGGWSRRARRSPGRSASCSRRSPGAAARLRARRPALGRADLPRPGRARRRPFARCADPAALHGAAGAPRPPAGLGRRQGERHDVLLEPLARRRDRRADREPRGLDGGPRERIRAAAEGNPLFVEEMVAMAAASRRRRRRHASPRRIQALLAARLDQLDAAERASSSAGRSRASVPSRRGPGARA